ncbi:MAG: KTSC domain-containing protein [Daejeonella sp.]
MPSSVIQYIEYFPESHILRVKFLSGITYDYKDVPPQVYKSFKIAGSKGRFLNFHIKGKFELARVIK